MMFRRKTVSNDVDKFKTFTEALEKLQAARHEAYKIGTDYERTAINILINQALKRSTGYSGEPEDKEAK